VHLSRGTRNRTTEPLKKFYDGAFKLAVDAGHAIIPAVILNTKKCCLHINHFGFGPVVLKFIFCPRRFTKRNNRHAERKSF
jgi:1-acyl-sn-glycerol-3-phosphate acyltransferase